MGAREDLQPTRAQLRNMLQAAGVGNPDLRSDLVAAWVELAIVKRSSRLSEERRLRQIERKRQLRDGEIDRSTFDSQESGDPAPNRERLRDDGSTTNLDDPAGPRAAGGPRGK